VYEISPTGEMGSACCLRPTWEEYERCVWHADASGKPGDDLEALRPEPGERLDGAKLFGVSLVGVDWFRECVLVGATFEDAALHDIDFTGTDLRRSVFENVDASGATFDGANIEDAIFRNADLRGASFDGTRLYRTVFTDTRINQETDFGEGLVYEETAVASDDHEEMLTESESALWTYQTLQGLLETNALPGRSLTYYLREMDLRRRTTWRAGDYLAALRLEGSRWVMRYGSSPWRVIASSVVLMVLCALAYPLTGGVQEVGIDQAITYSVEDPSRTPAWWLVEVFFTSLYFSAVTFATLGYGDIQPVGPLARTIAGLESLVGSMLMALLVFVLTRRMRWVTGTR
jgi:hypothetical protein